MVARKRTTSAPVKAAGDVAAPAVEARPDALALIAQVALAAAQAAAEEHEYVVGDCPILHYRREPYQPGDIIRLTRSAAAQLGAAVTIHSQG